MKLSMDTFNLQIRYGDEKAIQMMKKAGFDCIDYTFGLHEVEDENRILGDSYLEHAYKVREILDQNEISCNQAHAPFRVQYGDKFDETEKEYLKVVRAMEAASIMGAPYIVVHAIKVPDSEDVFSYNYEYYKSLEPYCEKFGIRVAIENLFKRDERSKCIRGRFYTAEQLNGMIEKLNSSWFVVCIDLGHAGLTGYEPQDLIRRFDKQVLRTLHVHDTEYTEDSHTLPYAGKFDWKQIAHALKDIGYEGDMTLEIFRYFEHVDDDFMEDALEIAVKTGRHLIKLVEA